MSTTIPLTAGTMSEEICYPPNPSQLASLLSEFMTIEIPDFSFFNFGSSQPAVDDQDKPWVRKNISGYPMGTYVFNAGDWRKATEFTVGQIVLQPNAVAIVSPWSPTDGSIVNGYTTATIANDAWHSGYKTAQYVGDY